MDIKLTDNSNGPDPRKSAEPFFEFDQAPEMKKRFEYRRGWLFLSVAALFLTCAWFLIFTNYFRLDRFTKDPSTDIVNDQGSYLSEQIIRYGKNLQRYFVYFKGFQADSEVLNSPENGLYMNNQALERAREHLLVLQENELTNLEQKRYLMQLEIQRLLNSIYALDAVYQENTDSAELEEEYEREFEQQDARIKLTLEESANFRLYNDISGYAYPAEDDSIWYAYTENQLISSDLSAESVSREALYYVNNYIDPLMMLEQQIVFQQQDIRERYNKRIADLGDFTESALDDARLENYYDVKRYLEMTHCFNYYITDSIEGLVYSNIKPYGNKTPSEIAEEALLKFPLQSSLFQSAVFNDEILSNSFYENGLNGYIIVPESILARQNMMDDPYDIYDLYHGLLQSYKNMAFVKLVFVTLTIVCPLLWLLVFVLERKSLVQCFKLLYHFYSKLPLIFKLCAFFSAVLWIAAAGNEFYYENLNPYYWNPGYTPINIMGSLGVLSGATVIAALCILLCIAHGVNLVLHLGLLKKEPEIRLIINCFSDLFFIYKQRNPSLSKGLSLLIALSAALQLGMLFVAAYLLAYRDGFLLVFLLLELIFLLLCFTAFYALSALARVHYYTEEIINGKLDEIEISRGFYRTVILKLNLLRGGVRQVLGERNKSDRLKTELITNVSHDLKTPLTSIINYIELLKTPNLPEQEKLSYLDILDSKSQRLKVLIEDLFEAAKLSSGQIELEKETVDLVALLNQALGELSMRIESSGVIFKFTSEIDHVPINVDANKIWRVFENLIINIVKYGQRETRAYIQIEDTPDSIIITFKNTANYEMNFDVKELFERFKRGDESRATEGSGLGLSIARDIIELHGGMLDIAIDGDLFKVIIVLFKDTQQLL